MRGWSRSLVVLGMAFVGTAGITLALVAVLLQGRAPSTAESTPTPAPTFAVGAAPAQTGGSLVVSGDREGSLTLDRDSYDVSINPDFERGFARVEFGRFGLLGEAGAVWFQHDPLAVEQIDFDGLAIYPEPNDCAITPGELNPAIGVASAQLECVDVTDLRDAGTVTLAGAIALPADMLGMRGDLPPSGGRVDVGSRTIEFSDGRMLVQDAILVGNGRQPVFLYGDDEASSLGFERDPQTGDLYLTYLVVDQDQSEIDDEACEVSTAELGTLNPITTVVDLSIRCEALDLGDAGMQPIDASLVVDLIMQPGFVNASR